MTKDSSEWRFPSLSDVCVDNSCAFVNRNFDEALRFSQKGVEDSWMNWLGLFAILAAGIIPIVLMQRNRTKPLKKRREVFWWLPLQVQQVTTHARGCAGPTKPSKK